MSKDRVYVDLSKATCGCFFLDSGAHSIWNEHALPFKNHEQRYRYYRTKRFWRYVDRYAAFVKKYRKGIDYYVNVDAIYNPEISWKVLKYLEQRHLLNPVPVIHHKTPLKWVERHLDAGYTLLGVGGLGQESTRFSYISWADKFFNLICDNKDRLPVVRIHGFAMTSHALMIRYPWWSVDSASWAKAAGFGSIYVPYKRKGQFTFDKPPLVLAFSHRSSSVGKSRHYWSLTKGEKQVVQEWLDEIEVPLGLMDGKIVVDYGVASQYNARALANARFLDRLGKWLPKWPWPFQVRPRHTFF